MTAPEPDARISDGAGLPALPDATLVSLVFDDVQLGGYAWWGTRAAPAVLLLHGWGEDASTMAPVARQVRGRGWHAVSLSLRGWRGSSGADDYGRSASQDIGRVLDWLRAQPDVSGVVVVGFSMGGLMAALAAADQEPGAPDGLVLVSAPSDLPTFARDTAFGGVRRYLRRILQPGQWRESSPLTHADRLAHPVLVVVGEADEMTPPEQGRRLAAAAPDAALLEIAEMGHHPSAEQWSRILDSAGVLFHPDDGSDRAEAVGGQGDGGAPGQVHGLGDLPGRVGQGG